MDILADNGYYTNQTVHDIYEEWKYYILMSNREQAGKQKDRRSRRSQRKTNHNKKYGFSKHNMIKNEETTIIYVQNKILPVKQVYSGKYNDQILYYISECSKYSW